MFQPDDLRLYFICGTEDISDERNIVDVVKEALSAGITMFQFREKGKGTLSGKDKELLAIKLKELCHSYNVPFIVNDDVSLAIAIDADGIHVGQDDEDVEQFAQQFQHKIIGLSVGNIEEYQHSNLAHVDYIGVGPMFPTSSKDDANAPVGPEMITQLREKLQDFPMVGIGGISLTNYKEVMDAKANGVSVISAIAQSDDIKSTVHHFLQYVD
ncbi:thiamine phosphate synthase [Staphylococcus kloosii]|jgi:thiamine-phosphate pyrophosphorylase|uniref:thiamine phosphate synthase n=1 Tax=Staphylococcus kloosii TaxID=29384 RepID=UPI00189C7E76|nr:thiamine phosphate synthase [Staphylococcus kloosii]MBF7025809.1 thiamine phosphate synthase [Staphylococcus kloosii]